MQLVTAYLDAKKMHIFICTSAKCIITLHFLQKDSSFDVLFIFKVNISSVQLFKFCMDFPSFYYFCMWCLLYNLEVVP